MNKVIEQELVERLKAARALETKIKALQDAQIKLTKLAASGHAVTLDIESSTCHLVKLQANTSSFTAFEPSEMHCILSLSLLVVEKKLDKLKQAYEEL